MKKLVLCLGLLSTSVYASLQVDESLIESRSNLRETLHSLKELQTSSKLSQFEKKGLLELSTSITKRYSSLELFAIKSDIFELHSQLGVKISVVSDSYRLSQSKDAKPLYKL
ncbi:MAG: hypothetical protein KC493_17570, partial [Bacteriovoracaceae bacterium]|nr:hypothetical protein [Bacteriovoracaceae bacterium]